MSEPQAILINLNPNGVAGPTQRVIETACQVVGMCLRAIENDDLAAPEMMGENFGYRFPAPSISDEEKRETYKNWVLSKAFQDLARGIRETLEEAMIYLSLIIRKPSTTTISKLEEEITKIRKTAATLNFANLLDKVNGGLTAPMSFDAEFKTLQKTRNCLEHRGGRVGATDIDQTTGKLVLSFPRLQAYYIRGQEEIEVVPGAVIDTHSPENQFGKGGEVPIFIRRVTRSREYVLDEPVIITTADFYEIAMACYMFAGDVAAKLPATARSVLPTDT